MKKIKQLGTIAFLALALTFSSCSSDSDGSSTGPAGDGTITAKVDGSTVTTMSLASFAFINGVGEAKALQITGADATAKAFTLQIVGFTGNGTYNTGTDMPTVVLTYTATDINNPQNTNNTWVAGGDDGSTGTITVTEYTDTKVKGTFSFKGKNQAGTNKDVTNGSFNVAIQ